MSQLGDNISYTETELDATGSYKDLGVFRLKTLNDLQLQHKDLPGITNPQLPSTAIPGYSKVVGDIKTFGSRLTQSETAIDLLVVDVNNAQAQLTIQAGQITSLVSDVAGNTSSITQNSNSIASLVTQTNSNYSLIQQNASAISLEVTNRTNADGNLQSQITVNANNINLKVSKSNIINEINLSTEGITISGSKISITGSTTFASGYDPSTKETPAGSQAKVNTLQSSLGSLAYDNLVESAKLGTTIVAGGYIKTSLLNVNDIFAQNITATGTITGATLRTASSGARVTLDTNGIRVYESSATYNSGLRVRIAHDIAGTDKPGIGFWNDAGSDAGNIRALDSLESLVWYDGLVVSKSFFVRGNLLVGTNSSNEISVRATTTFSADVKMSSTADILLGGSGSRIYDSTKTYYIYYNGTNWVLRDSAGVRNL